MRRASLEFANVKFPRDSVHQKLLKSVHFPPSYAKYKHGDVFLRHDVKMQCCIRIHTRTMAVSIGRRHHSPADEWMGSERACVRVIYTHWLVRICSKLLMDE